MKIVHVCLCGSFGEQYAYQDNLLPRYHKLLGHSVTVIAPTYSTINPNTGKLEEDLSGKKVLQDGVTLIRLKPFLFKWINIRLHLFKGLYNALCEEKPELLFVHGLDSLTYRSVIKYHHKKPSVTVVFDNHADWENSYHSIFSLLWVKLLINPLIVRPTFAFTKFYYGVTPARCDLLVSLYKVPSDRVKLLPMGADDVYLDVASRDIHREEIRNKYNIDKEDFLIVTGGKIDTRKNIHVLSDAVAELYIPNVKLLIFGSISDDLKPFFNNLHSDNVILTGWVPSTDVYRYFHAADLVFFPGLHSVLWEQAIASQVPCVFTMIKGFEHVNFNNNCVFLQEISKDSCKKTIETLHNDKSYYLKLKENAESKKALDFTYSKIAKSIIEDIG